MARASRVRSGDARCCKRLQYNRSRDLFERCMGNRSAAKEPVHILDSKKVFGHCVKDLPLWNMLWRLVLRQAFSRACSHSSALMLLSIRTPWMLPSKQSSTAARSGRVSHPDTTGDLCDVCEELFAWVLSGKVMVNQVFRSPLSASVPLVDSPLYTVFPY